MNWFPIVFTSFCFGPRKAVENTIRKQMVVVGDCGFWWGLRSRERKRAFLGEVDGCGVWSSCTSILYSICGDGIAVFRDPFGFPIHRDWVLFKSCCVVPKTFFVGCVCCWEWDVWVRMFGGSPMAQIRLGGQDMADIANSRGGGRELHYCHGVS